ncbi:MAG: hypothetical protein C0615_06675 [Desulfuromonas sp.]|mgnify:CR=1 FL=1|nr:MAG: hypothetical protein C0615_06675 [Desulfuromonas sp.]
MVTNEIQHQVLAAGHNDALLESTVAALVEEHGKAAYKEVMTALTGKNFGTAQSAICWLEAQQHRQTIEQKCGWRLSLRSALLDYLQQQTKRMTNPVIIEAEFLENIRHSSITDGLTGLFDQLYFKGHLHEVLNKTPRNGTSQAAVILLDLDHFKQYNDRCGHLAGDEVLARVADIIRTQVRDGDVVARYGGEEFAVFLPRCDRGEACNIAERIRQGIAAADFPGQALLDRKNLTISGGLAVFPKDGADARALIDKADQELYRAKTRRNCIYPSKCERRDTPRHKVSSLVEFTRTGQSFESGVVFDISKGGLAFSCSDALEQEERVTLRFQKPFWRDNFFCEGNVRRIQRLDDIGLNFVALEFDSLFDDFIRYIPGHASTH